MEPAPEAVVIGKTKERAMNDNTSKETRIRQQAYLIWLEEGQPEGRDKEHWEQAERTVDRMDDLSQDDERGDATASGAPLGPGQT